MGLDFSDINAQARYEDRLRSEIRLLRLGVAEYWTMKDLKEFKMLKTRYPDIYATCANLFVDDKPMLKQLARLNNDV